jgi:plasmid maintenance system antidote protein VapI
MAGFWYDLQAGYDMWQASRKKRPRIERFDVAAWGRHKQVTVET